MRKLNIISSLFFLNLFVIFFLHYIAGDTLLFLVDFYTLTIYVTFISICMIVVQFPLLLLKRIEIIHKISFVLINLIFIYFIFNITFSFTFDFVITDLLVKFYHFLSSISQNFADKLKMIYFVIVNSFLIKVFITLIIFYIIFKIKLGKNLIVNFKKILPFLKEVKISTKLNEFVDRSKIVTLSIFFVAIIFFSYHMIYSTFFLKKIFDKDQKNIVLLVLDAWSADLIYDYNEEAKNKFSFINKLDATVYDNFRTIYPHTAHFFKFFYSGKPAVKNFDQALQKNKIDFSKSFETNFIKTLQDKGINFRLFTFHRAAIPEGTDFGIKNYKGLRSYYLTEQTAFIPRFLNLEYNPLNSTSKSITKKLKYNFSKYIKNKTINKNKSNDLEVLLIPELKKIINEEKNFLYIYHQRWDQVIDGADFLNYYDPEEEFSRKDECHQYNKRMKKKDMTYSDEFAKNCIEYINDLKQKASDLLTENLEKFFKENDNFIKKNNIEFIILSDHGYMTRDNKMSYGFHFEEYAVKTPMMVFDGGKTKISKNFFTLDLIGYILKNYGIDPNHLYKYANPLKYADQNKFYTFSIIRKGQYFKNWYLSYYDQNEKRTLNLHPENVGDFSAYEIEGFKEKKIGNNFTDKDKEIFSEIFKLIDLDKNQVSKNLHYLF